MGRAGRVAGYPISAFSVTCALGTNKAEVAAKLRDGQSGLAPCTSFAIDTWIGAVPGELPALPARLASFDTRTARLAVAALADVAAAVERACALWGRDRVAIVLGGSTAGMASTEQAYGEYMRSGQLPDWWSVRDQHDFGAVLQVLRHLTSAAGPSYVVSTACSSSGKAIAAAQRLLASGRADTVLCGGVDSLCELTLRGFSSLGILARDRCRPFCREQRGINIGEGAGLFVLEREADADYALLGTGESSDAYHMATPHPQGTGAELAIRAALAMAGLDAEEIGHVNAHGTGTEQNDRSEALAIARVLGSSTPTLSTKSYTGHALGAAGAIEAALALLCIEGGFLPASLGCGPRSPDLGIDIVVAPRALPPGAVLSNSFAFGGSNVSLILGRAA